MSSANNSDHSSPTLLCCLVALQITIMESDDPPETDVNVGASPLADSDSLAAIAADDMHAAA
jgi:hypothetical protein